LEGEEVYTCHNCLISYLEKLTILFLL
jgi:hypothetical protein